MDDDGLQDAAILMMTLGAETAAEVFKHLTPKEVQRIGEQMAKLKIVKRERVEIVLDRFKAEAGNQASLVSNTDDYVRDVLKLALGEDKAGLLLDRILQGSDVTGIESLKWMDGASIAELIRNEHPQIVASILAHLDRDHAASVLQALPDRTRNEVLVRVATLDGIQPQALKELNDVLTKVLAGGDRVKKQALGGTKTAAEILNFLGGAIESSVIASIREIDPDLAQKIEDQMFTFADVGKIDDRGIQLLLREVPTEALVLALKGADNEMREKIFRNMSSRAAETLREDLDSRGPVRLSEVEAQQKEILKIVKRLADEGQIALGGGDDAFL